MSEICIEHCAIERDCSAFEPKPNLSLADMPRFPKTEGMTKEEKFVSVTIYLSKVVDHLQGVDHEETAVRIRRPHSNGNGRSHLPENLEIENLSPNPKESDPTHSD